MKFTREQYLELMTFGNWDRPMFVELFGSLIGLDKEWFDQGATREEIDLTAFDWDYVPVVPCGCKTGVLSDNKRTIIEDTDVYQIEQDELGRKTKLLKGYSTLPLPLGYPVKDMDSWLKIKKWFQYTDERINWPEIARAQKEQRDGGLVVAEIPGAFWTLRELMGEEIACLSFYTQPELVQDIISTLTETEVIIFHKVIKELRIDQLSVHEDMAGKSGPLIGPKQIEEFIKPYYTSVWELLSSKGTKIFDVDSDGNINSILDVLLECGINSMHPFEPASGMDIVDIRKKYGERIVFRGGIDKFVLTKDKEAIRKELEYKMQPSMIESGGIAFGLDHRIVNGTPIENYRYYVNLGREMLNIPPLNEAHKGWQRMAF